MNNKRMLLLGALALVGLAIGYYASLVYVGVTGSFASMTTACRMLQTAQKAGVLNQAQRDAVIDEMLAKTARNQPAKGEADSGRAHGTKMIADAMKGDCNLLKLE